MKYYNFKAKNDMNCDIRLFASEEIYKEIEKTALKQLFDASKLPGTLGVVGLPDIHQGYGLPIGGVLVTDSKKGVISPGAVGYDINCGVRLLKSNLQSETVDSNLNYIIKELKENIPAGVGSKSSLSISKQNFKELIEGGIPYLVNELNLGIVDDISACERKGFIEDADINKTSKKAVNRGLKQLGTLGGGNHFLEIQQVKKVYDKNLSFQEGEITFMIHTGSRGFGHQIAKDYTTLAKKEGVKTPTAGLASFPVTSNQGENYRQAMNCAANFAFANRQVLTHKLRKIINGIIPGTELSLYYDLCHNICHREIHTIDEQEKEVLVHRKGATRLTENNIALIPGSMGTSSYIVTSQDKRSNRHSFASVAHGAGRKMGRRQAKRSIDNNRHRQSLGSVKVVSGSGDNLLDESPLAYKKINKIIESLSRTGLARPLVKLKPLAVLKG